MKGGTREILEKNKYIISTDFLGESGLPMINVVQYPLGPLIQIRGLDIIINPCYYMVLEDTFYQLMEDVQWQQIMDVSLQKIGRKWLNEVRSGYGLYARLGTDSYLDMSNNPIIVP